MTLSARHFLLPVALLQLLVGYVPRAIGLGTDIGTRATENGIPPELPPGVFFAIWGVIFTAYIAFAIYGLQKNSALTDKLSMPLVLAGLANSAWMLVAQLIGSTAVETLILLPLIWAAWLSAYRFDTMRGLGGSAIKWTADLLTGLLSGWAIVALAISLPRLAREMLGLGPTDNEWYALWTVIITVQLASMVFRRKISRTIWFYVALSWGILGIIVNNWTRTELGFLAWVALIFGIWLIGRRLIAGASGARRASRL